MNHTTTYALERRTAIACMGIGYFAWALLSVTLSRQPGNLAVLWFANAWAVGILLCRPRREAPLLLTVQAVSNSFISVIYGDPMLLLLAFSACNVVEVGLAAALLGRHFAVGRSFQDPATFMRALLLGAVIPAATGAALGSLVLSLAGLASPDVVWLGWFMGSLYGYMAFASLVVFFLYHRTVERIYLPALQHLAYAALCLVAAYMLLLNFSHPYSLALGVMVLLLIWAPPFEGAIANLGLAVLMACMKSVQWREEAAIGEKPDLVQDLLPALAVLFIFSVLLSHVKANKLSNEKLKQRERFIQSVTDGIPGMVGYWDAKLHNKFANRAYLSWFGKSPQEIAGMHMSKLLGPEIFAKNLPYIEGALAGKAQTFSRTLTRIDGSVHHTVAEYIPDVAGGVVQGFVAMVTDVTEIEETKSAALSASHAKSGFLAIMSHEIRTPLNAIVGMSHLLSLSKLTPEQAQDVHAVASSSKSLLALVNDVLDFSKIEANEFVLEKKPFSLPEVIQDLRSMFSPMAADKGLSLAVPAPAPGIPTVLEGDADRLRQILINLLNNAMKFTPAGSVSLAVVQEADCDADRTCLAFTVADTGIGIAEDFHSKLFEPFCQADASTSRQYGGTGLGLSIVERIAKLMGGSIRVSSQLGQGTSFEVRIPFARSQALIPSRESFVNPRNLHILVAEDDEIERRVLMQACREFGWQVEGTDNGRDMVEMVQSRLAQHNPIDCVVLDWRMPRLDGVQALEELAQRVDARAMPSVIMVTANDKSALQKAIGKVQPDSILTKPVNRSVLFNSVNEAVVSHGKGLSHVINATVIHGNQVNWLNGVRILVVDDSSMNLEVTRRILESEGAQAVVCESGEAALEVLRTQEHMDAVLMDLQMPGMDGYETTRRILQMQQYGRTTVIALTAGATVTEKERALQSGMVDFLAKPVDPIRLIRVLREHIEARRAEPLKLVQDQQPVEAAGPQGLKLAGPTPVQWPRMAGIDSALASTMMGGDVAFFKEILADFRKEHAPTLASLQSLVDASGYEQAARLAHKLKGQAGNIGATALREAAGRLEQAMLERARDGQEAMAAVAAALTTIMKTEA